VLDQLTFFWKEHSMSVFGAHGTTLYEALTGKYELNPDELEVATMAARSADDLALLEAALVGAAVMVPGSMGQERVNPLFAEVRATRALIGQLVGRLKLPDEDAEGERATTNTNRARKAAGARWNH
jgi:hypothetical protein